jgi:hypothetical protein
MAEFTKESKYLKVNFSCHNTYNQKLEEMVAEGYPEDQTNSKMTLKTSFGSGGQLWITRLG